MAELGEELRRERVRRNLTFKDVEQVLHIKTTYLEAIEDGKYDIIPGQVYVKGFIRNYGNYLDLDGDRLVKAYQSQVGDIHAMDNIHTVYDMVTSSNSIPRGVIRYI